MLHQTQNYTSMTISKHTPKSRRKPAEFWLFLLQRWNLSRKSLTLRVNKIPCGTSVGTQGVSVPVIHSFLFPQGKIWNYSESNFSKPFFKMGKRKEHTIQVRQILVDLQMSEKYLLNLAYWPFACDVTRFKTRFCSGMTDVETTEACKKTHMWSPNRLYCVVFSVKLVIGLCMVSCTNRQRQKTKFVILLCNF